MTRLLPLKKGNPELPEMEDTGPGPRPGWAEGRMARRGREIAAAVTAVTGHPVQRMSYPGGRSRASVRCHLGQGRSVIATRRRDPDRLALEERLQHVLHRAGAPVPEIIGRSGRCLIQQDAGPIRLSQALWRAGDAGTRAALLEQAAAALQRCQHALARRAGSLDLPVTGSAPGWRQRLVSVPANISARLQIAPPAFDRGWAADFIAPVSPVPVKWDARPGNAIAAEGGVVWIDWDHAGRRDPLDDLAWLLCDEYLPDDGALSDRLADALALQFRGGRGVGEARDYLRCMGVLHSAVRLELIVLWQRRTSRWADFEQCLAKDRIGRTMACLRRLCQRAARWAEPSLALRPLSAWFETVAETVGARDPAPPRMCRPMPMTAFCRVR